MYNEVLKEKYMKEQFIFVFGIIVVVGSIVGSAVYNMRLQHHCTIAGMMAGYDASEIRVICR